MEIRGTLRKFVGDRAEGICEYCLINIEDTYFGGEIDHILSVKHSGGNSENNLALACQPCNRGKRSDLMSYPANSTVLTRFYNPREDVWAEHFYIENGQIFSKTLIGEITAKIFRFNDWERVLERLGLIEIGHFPSNAAARKINGF